MTENTKQEYSSCYLRSLNELYVLLAGWTLFMAWTLIASGLLGYDPESSKPELVLGLPKWIFWGVLIPWISAGLFTIWFALFYITDDDEEFYRQAGLQIAPDDEESHD